MNRRDTIIIATLVNAVLVLVLFTTAKYADKKNTDVLLPPLPAKLVEVVPSMEKAQEKVEKPIVETVPQRVSKEELAAQFAENKPVVVKAPPANNVPQTPPSVPITNPISHEPKVQVVKEAPKKEAYATVIVKKGDFLERIAKANHTTVAVLMQINDLSSTQLKIGQVLKVPISDKQEETKKSQVKISTAEDFYTVQEGDSPWTIALRNHIRLEDLLRMNDLDEHKARRLRPGDQLRIR
ncbi:D-gamma-glutamyl-meso-diaminopimelic acid endopeptidase CwlS precursor,membrane-bound lytic murein transglycosylase D,stage VI sporulation protein D,LysM domain [Chlamydia poikilotherma]|uniref:D-gamma-glutamyl-meso-diaminopimelic acid endopeptidase CwlS,membrane-bound lytic murein transglycosylase D,stage VI sporulation protein D,LysM domain n=1 Tax=Chlamydia poikilotherma TaxID=1967783 RepID=A0A3B0QIA3_9CHLA|nr:LysM peptidoglycan-binding domain-containing protein [Chlamydia poikilotherma]SYX09324.1 D-gamma-glutamyl-meso-diaminopimelic acid endopeptidase CwlS precursor,membrane-bound lytic murein transglycosylase D,stage VI sporulation protein D,LysM domain [Chlamydia poikilotherma]